MPQVRGYKDGSRLAFVILAILSTWTWLSSSNPEKPVQPVEICCQVSNGCVPGLLACTTAWLPREEIGVYPCAATDCPCQIGALCDALAHMMSNHSIPWTVLLETKEQCPIGTISSDTPLGAADAFDISIDLAGRKCTSPLQKGIFDSTSHNLGACQVGLLETDVS